jgi:RNA 3'-terminal phosphate cyclase
MNLASNEAIILEAKANLNPRGGRLTLTNQKLVFTPNKIHFGASPTEIPLDTIKSCEAHFMTLLFVIPIYKCGVTVETKSGEEFNFVVTKWSKWHAEIEQARG